METKFCKLPLDFGALLSEDVENSRLASCTEIESIDQFIEMLIDTAPGEHAFDKEFGCEIFYLDFESIISHTRWEGQFSDYITQAITRYEKRLTNVNVRVIIDDTTRQDNVFEASTIKKTRAGICLWQSGAYRREALFLLCDLFRTHFNPMTSV
ncbi:GPW/gp25 family protein [Bacteroides fragilis]